MLWGWRGSSQGPSHPVAAPKLCPGRAALLAPPCGPRAHPPSAASMRPHAAAHAQWGPGQKLALHDFIPVANLSYERTLVLAKSHLGLGPGERQVAWHQGQGERTRGSWRQGL